MPLTYPFATVTVQVRSPASLFGVDVAARIVAAARLILPQLERGRRIDGADLRAAMDASFAGSDVSGAWDWKSAYDACEVATVLFLRKYGPAMRERAAGLSGLVRGSEHLLARVHVVPVGKDRDGSANGKTGGNG